MTPLQRATDIVRDAEIGHEDYGWRRFDGRLLRQERARDEE
jgi:hypothetical protein